VPGPRLGQTTIAPTDLIDERAPHIREASTPPASQAQAPNPGTAGNLDQQRGTSWSPMLFALL
jgi:hypothetical protein